MPSMRCASLVPPSVAAAMACVSPRVKSELPCVRGSRPPSQLIGRTTSTPRPSCRLPVCRIISFTIWDSTRKHASRTSTALNLSTPCSPPSAPSAAMALLRIFSTAAPRTCFTPMASAYASSPPIILNTTASMPSGATSILPTALTRPTSAAHASMSLHAPATASCPFSMAYSISSVLRKSPKPSIMRIASAVPASTKSSREVFICSAVGLMTGSEDPGSSPTRTPAMGFLRGTSEMAVAAEAAVMASASVERTPS
mmetsp:Transcript_23976/g.58761  ORF Transcript_23976/g.58761 Transcript_23976/m.58761 type:complete len:256 (-) Transcript_23976:477-1244(-)